MKIISNPKELQQEFKRLINAYSFFDAAVAWAGTEFIAYKELVANKAKIGKMIIGLEFYQTAPAFIREFLEFDHIRYNRKTDGVFHPKIYIFYDSESKWELLIGSPNFTRSAFVKNDEISVIISDEDQGQQRLYSKCEKLIDGYWEASKQMTSFELDEYEAKWRAKQAHRSELVREFMPHKIDDHETAAQLLEYTWEEYYEKIKADPNNTTKGRIEVLSDAHKYFLEYATQNEMSDSVFRKIAGLAGKSDRDWRYFGSMGMNFHFRNAARDSRAQMLEALDEIPLELQVNEANFFQFMKIFMSGFKNPTEKQIGPATRLLAMKRPDIFLCLDGANRVKIREVFQLQKFYRDFARYWYEIILRIQETPWWKSPVPKGAEQQAVWRGRVAFLDAIFYEPN
jgi:HKD family nuclease